MSGGGFRCLAIETATDAPAVAACNGDRVAEQRFGGARQTQDIFTHVDAVLAEVGRPPRPWLSVPDCPSVRSRVSRRWPWERQSQPAGTWSPRPSMPAWARSMSGCTG